MPNAPDNDSEGKAGMFHAGCVYRHDSQQTDPSQNVENALNAAVQRLDDLRAESVHARETAIASVKELMAVHAMYTEKLQIAEAKRIDAIRAVDVNAVSVASERAAAQATVLANQVSASADALRTLVASTATAMATQSAQQVTQLSDRIASLEKSAYEGVGKGRVQDPMMENLLAEVKALRTSSTSDHGRGEGMSKLLAILISVGAVVIAAVTLIVKVGAS